MSLDLTDGESTLTEVITLANGDPDICHQMASLGHNELFTVYKNSGKQLILHFISMAQCNVRLFCIKASIWAYV